MELLREIMEQTELSPRGMAKLRGKFGHQFRCVEGVAPLLVPFNNFIGGPKGTREWDEAKTDPSPPLRNYGSVVQVAPEAAAGRSRHVAPRAGNGPLRLEGRPRLARGSVRS